MKKRVTIPYDSSLNSSEERLKVDVSGLKLSAFVLTAKDGCYP